MIGCARGGRRGPRGHFRSTHRGCPMSELHVLWPLTGGLLIGLSTALYYLLFAGRVAGISGLAATVFGLAMAVPGRLCEPRQRASSPASRSVPGRHGADPHARDRGHLLGGHSGGGRPPRRLRHAAGCRLHQRPRRFRPRPPLARARSRPRARSWRWRPSPSSSSATSSPEVDHEQPHPPCDHSPACSSAPGSSSPT